MRFFGAKCRREGGGGQVQDRGAQDDRRHQPRVHAGPPLRMERCVVLLSGLHDPARLALQ